MRYVLLLIGLMTIVDTASANCAVVTQFPDSTLEDWHIREFDGSTDYALVTENGQAVLEAHTVGAASILYRKLKIDVAAHPRLTWSWRIDGIYEDIDEQSRGGDDFPARIYVVAKTGMLPWSTLAINYIWASDTPVGTDWRSPYTNKAQMIPVRSGEAEIGKWVCQSRDVVADFKTAFGVSIKEIEGFAVMVDGDNTGLEGRARFGDIAFSP